MTKKTNKGYASRTAIVVALFMLWLAVIGARAGYLQIYRGPWLSNKAAVQYERELTIHGKRGAIYDRRHQAMAVSIETTSVAAYPPMVENKLQAAAKLAKALGVPKKHVEQKLASKRSFVWLKRQATPRQVNAVKKYKIKGIDFLSGHSRFYPNTTLAAQLLGFTGIDGHGLEGLEFYFDKDLKGEEYTITMLKDALGRGFETDQWVAESRAGNNLILTIDRQIQYIVENALAQAVTENEAVSGMAIVMEPQTGALLAVAHYPFFNPNTFRKYDRTLWRNRAITDPFEPGSTMKIFSAAAALENGVSNVNTIFYCENGSYALGGHTVNDTKPHGWLSLQQIIKYSSNIGTVKIIEKVGQKNYHDYLQSFGFGNRTKIDCPGESAGSLPHFRRWTRVDTAAIAFGQGVSATALQLITAACALANDGVMMRPYIVKAVTDSNGRTVRTVNHDIIRRVVSAETSRIIRRIMKTVIASGGTGERAALEGYSVCGKTGTAQKIDATGKYAKDRYVASFLGFAPAENPALAVLVVVDEPRKSLYGGLAAAPAFKQIVKETLSCLDIAPGTDVKKLRVSSRFRGSG
ncbi:MAG: penicillin-binding protein 2 [Desulfobacteraceae bacterium]|nr:penicillin-binding protein 2 [Desulfobacteraceae bacterium]